MNLNAILQVGKKVLVVVVHFVVAFGIADILAVLANNPNLQKYWPVINLLQVAIVKGIEYYNFHKDDYTLPPQSSSYTSTPPPLQ